MVEKAQEEVEEANKISNQTKSKNKELEHEVNKLLTKATRMRETELSLENQVLEERTKFDQVVKRNLLIDELNKEMMEMNIEDLCKFVNQSLYECVHTIRRSNIKEIIKTGDKVLGMAKKQGLTEVTESIEEIMKNFEFLREKEQPKQGKQIHKSNKIDNEKEKEKEAEKQKAKEEKKKARFEQKKEQAVKYNPKLKKLMNASKLIVKDKKTGKYRDKITNQFLAEALKKYKKMKNKGKTLYFQKHR